jgi:Arc/MetJ family transcription regulator
MRTTLNLKEDLYKEAAKATGIQEKTKLIHLGLQALIRETAAKRLSRLFGTVKTAKAPPRRRIPL